MMFFVPTWFGVIGITIVLRSAYVPTICIRSGPDDFARPRCLRFRLVLNF